jgi:hypothetical protein
VLETLVVLNELLDLQRVGARACGNADDPRRLDLYNRVQLILGHGVHHKEEALDSGSGLFLLALRNEVRA